MHRTTPKNADCSSASSDDVQHLKTLEDALPCLWILTPLIATLSLVVVFVSVFTNNWLQTEEKMQNPSFNGTGDREYLSKMTISGLWLLCITNRFVYVAIRHRSLLNAIENLVKNMWLKIGINRNEMYTINQHDCPEVKQ